MRIFKYWVEKTYTLKLDGEDQVSTFKGGSNLSIENAEKDAEKRFQRLQATINQRIYEEEEYEADIREEIIDKINDQNIITRNWYGALILNSSNQVFLDIDHSNRSLFDLLFRRSKSQKEINLERIRKTASKSKYQDLGFIIYETHSGYRVAVTGKDFKPQGKDTRALMKDFRSDRLYCTLCYKQNCYRARLTPKPYRIKQRKLRVIFPNRTEEQQSHHEQWVNEYDNKSLNYSTCKKIEEIGRVKYNDILKYHDKICRVTGATRLA